MLPRRLEADERVPTLAEADPSAQTPGSDLSSVHSASPAGPLSPVFAAMSAYSDITASPGPVDADGGLIEDPKKYPEHSCGVCAQIYFVPVDLHRDAYRSRGVAMLVMIPLLWGALFLAAQALILPGASPHILTDIANALKPEPARYGSTALNATNRCDSEDTICSVLAPELGRSAQALAVLHYALTTSDMGCTAATQLGIDGTLATTSASAALTGMSAWQGLVFAFLGFDTVGTYAGYQTASAAVCLGIPGSGLGSFFAITASEQLCPANENLQDCGQRIDAVFDCCLNFVARRVTERIRKESPNGIGSVILLFLALTQMVACVLFARAFAEAVGLYFGYTSATTCCSSAVACRLWTARLCGSGGTGYEGAAVPLCCVSWIPAPIAGAGGPRSSLAADHLRTASARFDDTYGTASSLLKGAPDAASAPSGAHRGGHPAGGDGASDLYQTMNDGTVRGGASTAIALGADHDEESLKRPVRSSPRRSPASQFGRVIEFLERGGDAGVLIDPPTRVWLILAVIAVMSLFLLVTSSILDASLDEIQRDAGTATCLVQRQMSKLGTINGRLGCGFSLPSVPLELTATCSAIDPSEDPLAEGTGQGVSAILDAVVDWLGDEIVDIGGANSCDDAVVQGPYRLGNTAFTFMLTLRRGAYALRTAIQVTVYLTIVIAVLASVRLVSQWRHVMAWVITSGRDKWSHRAAVWAGGGRGNPLAESSASASEVLGSDALGVAESAGTAVVGLLRRAGQTISEGLAVDDTSPIKQLPSTRLGYLSDVPMERFDVTLAGDLVGVASWSILTASLLLGAVSGLVVFVFLVPGGVEYIVLPLVGTYAGFFAVTEVTRLLMRRCCTETRPDDGCCGSNSTGYSGRVTAWRCFSWCDFTLLLGALGRGPGFGLGRLLTMMLGQASNLLSMERPIHSNSGLDRAFLAWGATVRGRIEAVMSSAFPDMGAEQNTKGCLC